MSGLLPMTPAFERALGVDKDIRDILDVADFVGAFTDLKQRIVPGTARVGRVEQQAMRKNVLASLQSAASFHP